MMKCCKSGSPSRVELNHKNNNKTHINYVSSRGETEKEEDDEDVEESRKVNIFNLNSKVGRFVGRSVDGILLFAIINYVMSTTTREHPSVLQKL